MIRPLLLISLFTLLCTCGRADKEVEEPAQPQELDRQVVQGEAMGTYYRITYLGDSIPRLQHQVDSLMDAFNLELSAWVKGSKINAFNASDSGIDLSGTKHFIPNLKLATKISEETNGAFDPTIGPLVKYWGFATGQRRNSATYDPVKVEELQALVGLEHISLEGMTLEKKKPGVELDLNASAKGYGVDLVAELLVDKGHPDYLVDIGGEMRGGGSKNGQSWRVAIRLPDEDKSKIASAGFLPLQNGLAIATSGNYLNYYEVDGETFSHTINPATGLVERNNLLSASVLAPDCATADAYATACMVLGPKAALELIESQPRLEAYFLTRTDNGKLQTIKSSGL